MAEVLVEFDTTLLAADGREFRPRACGRVADDGLWEGWLEFVAVESGGDRARTARETEQPNRDDLRYWAEGLTQVYLEGALARALAAPPAPSRPRETSAEPMFTGPRPRSAGAPVPHAVLNPYEVYAQGPAVLRRQLAAVDVTHLQGIAIAYGIAPASTVEAASREELSALIVAAAERAAGGT